MMPTGDNDSKIPCEMLSAYSHARLTGRLIRQRLRLRPALRALCAQTASGRTSPRRARQIKHSARLNATGARHSAQNPNPAPNLAISTSILRSHCVSRSPASLKSSFGNCEHFRISPPSWQRTSQPQRQEYQDGRSCTFSQPGLWGRT